MRLSWGHVVVNGVLAALLYTLFYNYQSVILGMLIPDIGTASLWAMVLSQWAIPLISQAALNGAILIGAILYAASVDDSPARLFKGILIGVIGISLGSSIFTSSVLGAYLGHYMAQFSSYFFGTPLLVSALGSAISSAGIIAAVTAFNAIEGAVGTGLIVALMPAVVGTIGFIYETLIYKPLTSALLKMVQTLSKRLELGFLLPIGIYVVSVLSLILYLPVLLIVLFWLVGVVLGALIGFFASGGVTIIFNAVGFALGVLIVVSGLNPLLEALFRRLSPVFYMLFAPIGGLIAFVVAAVPISMTLFYVLSILPAVAIIAAVALTTSPAVRGLHLDVYIPMFIALFFLQLFGSFIAFLGYLGSGYGSAAMASSAVFCIGGYNPNNLAAQFLFNSTSTWMSFIGCMFNVAPYYDYQTGCFNTTALAYLPSLSLTQQEYNWISATPEVPPYWWVPTSIWYHGGPTGNPYADACHVTPTS